MDKIYIKARAKINLSLAVLNKREDNFHNIQSVFQKINLYDELYIEKTDTNRFELDSNIPNLKTQDNIIFKAYIILKQKYINITGVKVTLNKKIPMQAGLGGGSTDCASFLIGMNKLFNLNLSRYEIESISKSLGADVIPCLYNKAILAEGIGDLITPINTDFKYYIVIVKPDLNCNTKEMYDLIDNSNLTLKLDSSNNIVDGLQRSNIQLIADNLYNSFEEIIPNQEHIKNIKEEFLQNNALTSLLSGSGSCVYGIFKDKISAKKAYINLSKKYKTYICTSFNVKRSGYFD